MTLSDTSQTISISKDSHSRPKEKRQIGTIEVYPTVLLGCMECLHVDHLRVPYLIVAS